MIILSAILLIVSAVAKYLCDRIAFKANFKSDWMLAQGKYSWDKRTWWTKNIFSFVSDGWHFFDAVRVMSLCISITILLGSAIWYSIVLYIIHGLIFEMLYRIK